MASIKRRPDGRWRARYRDDQGHEHSKHFDRKIDGETWLAAQTVAVATGAHVVPRLSRITVQAFYDDWSRRQVWASGTRTAMDVAMRSSGLGSFQLGQVSHSHIGAWIKCNARWVARRPPRRCGPTPTCGQRPRIAPAPPPPI